jgi:hypothetical protein
MQIARQGTGWPQNRFEDHDYWRAYQGARRREHLDLQWLQERRLHLDLQWLQAWSLLICATH